MRPFTYERAATARSAAEALARTPGARLVAGGTNLLDLMKLDIERPAHLVDVNRAGLDGVEPTAEGGLRIGAMVRNSDLAADPTVRRDYAVLARALLSGASGQLRNRATTAGNLLQRTRCPYFYETATLCNKRSPGSGCAALEGLSRSHAVLGASDACIATHPSDMAVAMRALDARVETVAAGGASRSLTVADLYRAPGADPSVDTVLGPDEVITAVTLPPPIRGVHVYRKVRDRASYAFATISLAAVLHREGGRVVSGRLAFGGLAHKPWRVEAADAEIARGAGHAAEIVLSGARTTTHNAFKVPLARRLVEATLAGAEGEGAR